MTPTETKQVNEALAVTQRVCGGRSFDKATLAVYLKQLSRYDCDAVHVSLSRCMQEIKGHVALSDIISRIDDGWPSPDEAWSMCPHSEHETVVAPDEALCAYGDVSSLSDDRVAQRMAFKDTYMRRREAAKLRGRKPAWRVSLGLDPAGREAPLRHAVEQGYLTPDRARTWLPDMQLPGDPPRKQLPEPIRTKSGPSDPETIADLLPRLLEAGKELRAMERS